jgi:hypothetical protein
LPRLRHDGIVLNEYFGGDGTVVYPAAPAARRLDEEWN